MPDQLYLSLWLRAFRADNMLRHFEQLLRVFPFSRLHPGISTLKIYALEFQEPPLLEEALTAETDVDSLIAACQEFHNADCAYVVEGWWEEWKFDREWRLTPSRVSLTCFGPLFDNDESDHLRIDFGPDTDFLPQPEIPNSARMAQSNLIGLLRLVSEAEESLPIERRSLWSESGENFAGRLETALSEEG